MSAELPLEKTTPIDADKLRALLRRKYPADQYAMLYEVRDAAGFQANRAADVIVVGLWPSRGCLVEGMELKVSRSDWLRELKKPQKAEAFFAYCDRWWVIASSADIVREGELPPTWGLMVPRSSGMGVIKQAPDLKPEPVDRHLLAAMLKRATDTTADSPEVRARIDVRVAELKGQERSAKSYELESATRQIAELRKTIADFEAASGVRIESYGGARIGEAVKLVLSGAHSRRLKELHAMKNQARSLVAWLDEHVPDAPDEAAT